MSLALISTSPLALAPGLTPGGRAVAEKMAGVTSPFGFWDPLNLVPETKEELMLFREAELAHSRVAMVGTLGFIVQEAFHPIFPDIGGPSSRQLDQVVHVEAAQAHLGLVVGALHLDRLVRANQLAALGCWRHRLSFFSWSPPQTYRVSLGPTLPKLR